MANLKGKHKELIIADLTEDPIIADTVSPGTRQLSLKGFAVHARVFASIEILEQPRDDDASDTRIELR